MKELLIQTKEKMNELEMQLKMSKMKYEEIMKCNVLKLKSEKDVMDDRLASLKNELHCLVETKDTLEKNGAGVQDNEVVLKIL
jgi:hypothetical protein